MYGQQPVRETIYINDLRGYAFKTTNTFLCFFLFLLSIGLFGFGIWLVVWTDNFNFIGVIMNYDIYRAGCILFIISGILLMIVSFIGLCGGTQENSSLLLAFVIVTIICEIMQIAIATMGMVFNQDFSNRLAANLTFAIQRMYGVNLHIPRNVEVTNAIDQMQTKFSCCGTIGQTNSSTSWELYKSSTWIITQNPQFGPPYVPSSCCVLNTQAQPSNLQLCQGTVQIGNPPAPPVLSSSTLNSFLNVQGCITSMSGAVNYFSIVMFGLALAAAIYMIIVLVISFCLLRRIEVSKKEMLASNANLVTASATSPGKKNNPNMSNGSRSKTSKAAATSSTKSLQEESPSMHTYDDSLKILK